jgi:putative ABC transport system substrate-binding protein
LALNPIAVSLCGSAMAQDVDKLPLVGLLTLGSSDLFFAPRLTAFREGLKQNGLIEAGNMRLMVRYADNVPERLAGLAGELAALGSRVIVTSGTTSVRAAHAAAPTVPIVMAGSADPVVMGFAQSLRRPGGKITGISIFGPESIGKQLEILKDAPAIRTLAAFLQAANPGNAVFREAIENAGRTLGLNIHIREIQGTGDIATSFEWAAKLPADGVFLNLDPIFHSNRDAFLHHATIHRLPVVIGNEEWVRAGALAGYILDFPAIVRRAAYYVAEILRGADPGTLPIEQPTEFRLLVNLKTAKTLGLTIPPAILARADEVIE